MSSGHDLPGVAALDEALWVATAAPSVSFRADPVFLATLVTGGDGRVSVAGVRAAITWLVANHCALDDVQAGNTTLRLEAIPPASAGLRRAAAWVVTQLGAGPVTSVDLAAVRHAITALNPAQDEWLRETAATPDASVILPLLRSLERLILYQAWLLPFANSFISAGAMFGTTERPLFSAGMLVLDGRWFRLAVQVPDAERHEEFVKRSRLCVMYVHVGLVGAEWEYEVALPVTAGTRGGVVEGLWGTFVEPDGLQKHARVRKVLTNPVSLRDAIFNPMWRLVETVDVAIDNVHSVRPNFDPASVAPVTPAPVLPGVPPKNAAATAGVVAILAGGGIAIAAIGSALTYISERFVAATAVVGDWILHLPLVTTLSPDASRVVGLLAYPIGIAVVLLGVFCFPVLLYLIPVATSAGLRLRRRDVGVLLAGAGWAMNTRLYLTPALSHRLTSLPTGRAAPSGQAR